MKRVTTFSKRAEERAEVLAQAPVQSETLGSKVAKKLGVSKTKAKK